MLLLNAAGGGLVGSLVGLILGAFNPFDDEQEVEVPCFNSIIMARHVFRESDLGEIFSEGMRRFGPRDNESSAVCENIDSYYWLSVDIPQWLFPPSTEPSKTGCTLEPRAYMPVRDYLLGRWGDIGDNYNDQILVSIILIDSSTADVFVTERRTTGNFQETWERRPIARGEPKPSVSRNFYDDPLIPPSSIKPACPYCSVFTNLLLTLIVPKELFIVGLLPGSHVGTRPIFPLKLDTDRTTAQQYCGCDNDSVNVRMKRANQRDLREPISLGIGIHASLAETGLVNIRRPGNQTLRKHGLTASPLHDIDLILHPELQVSWMVTAPNGSFIATYAELHDGKMCMRRLRYVRMGDNNLPLVDVMLEPLANPLH